MIQLDCVDVARQSFNTGRYFKYVFTKVPVDTVFKTNE